MLTFARLLLMLMIVLTPPVSSSSALAQTSTKSSLPSFYEPSWTPPNWVLSTLTSNSWTQKNNILSRFLPQGLDKIADEEFEQIQSIVIPGGILDVIHRIVYLDDTAGDIVALDLDSGQILQKINNICCPIAILDNFLIALSRSADRRKSPAYQLVMLDLNNNMRLKASWGPVFLPDWLDLPVDGERQKFVFSVHCYRWILSFAWQASEKSMFPNPLAILMSQSSSNALQGQLTVDLKSTTVVSQSVEEGNSDFLAYLTVKENKVSPQTVIDPDTLAIKTYYPYLFSLLQAFPAEHNISRAGVVAQRELQVKDMRTGEKLWSRTLPAGFIPLSY